MRRDEVGDQLVGQPLAAADAQEIGVQLFEKCERRLAHQSQNGILGVLGRDFQASRGVVFDHGVQIRAVVEQVVSDAAADKGLLDAFHGADLLVQSQQRPVVVIQVGALFRVQARRAAAFSAQLLVAAAHAVHVGRGRSDIRKVTFEIGHFGDPPHFAEDRAFAARVDELALVCRYGAERAAAEASPVDVYRVFYHLPRRNIPFAVVSGVRGALVGQVERVVELRGGERCVGRRDDHIAIAHGLDERRRRFHQVALRLDDGEILAESALVAQARFVGVQPDGLHPLEPFHVLLVGHERHLPHAAQQLGVVAVAHGLGDLLHDPLAHAVDQKVGARFGQHRGLERVVPVVVMGQAPEGGFDAAHDDRDMREQPFEDLGVDRHGIVGAEPRLAAGRVGVVAPQAQVGRVVVDHRVHRPGRDAEKEPRHAQLGEVAQIVAPVGLRHDGHVVAFGLQQAADHRRAERRVVDVCVAREEDDVQLIPSACADFLYRGR